MIQIILLNAFPEKKIKSLGNQCLINLSNNKKLIHHYINIFKLKYHKLTIVCGFEFKKLKKYVSNNIKSKNLKLLYHDINEKNNIGESISHALKNYISYKTEKGLLFINTNLVINKTIFKKFKFDKSFIIINSKIKDDIGCLVNKNNMAINCYYGLPNKFYDILYIHKNDILRFQQIQNTKNFNKLFLFEIVNLCIKNDINIKAIDIKPIKIPKIENIYHDKKNSTV
jgi:hypothetical protein